MVVVTVKKSNVYEIGGTLYQWDTNRRLDIYGLNFTELPEIHFVNSRMSEAIVTTPERNENGGMSVVIPNRCLETPAPITVYVCVREGDKFLTRYSFKINLKERIKPADYIADTEEKIYSYLALEKLVNNTIIELRNENETFKENLLNEVRETVNDRDTLGGFHAEEFELVCKPGTTVFNLDGSITTTYDDGSKETVVFNEDGSITITRNTLELGVKTEVVKFNPDGSITVEEV